MKAKELLRERLSVALSEVTLAESGLAETLKNLGTGGARAEKVSVTVVVTESFARLRRAHEALEKLRDLIESDDL